MKSKTKFIISISLVSVIAIVSLIGIIAVMASLKTTGGGNFKISYVAQNVNAKVSAKYAITDNSSSPSSWTTIKSGSNDYITFNDNDTAEAVTKSFSGIDVDITRNQYLYFKYTFEHTGTEANSMKFLNISFAPTLTTFNNMTMEYGTTGTDGSIYWTNELNELTAVRGESAVVDLYIRFYISIKTLDADVEGDFICVMSGSDEYKYDNAYLAVGNVRSTLGNVSPTSIVFESEASTASLEQEASATSSLIETNVLAKATTLIPLYINGSYGINAYMDGTTLHIASPYAIKAVSCKNLISNLTTNPSSVTSVTFTNFDTTNVIDMSSMFANCSNITTIDLSKFDTSKVTNMTNMFNGCSKLASIYAGSSWTTSAVTTSTNMFLGCTSLKGYDSTKTDKTFANTGSGYFTDINAPVIESATLMHIEFGNYKSLTPFVQTLGYGSGDTAPTSTDIIFDYYRDEYDSIITTASEVYAIDENQEGLIKLYVVGSTLYVLSEYEICANSDCSSMFEISSSVVFKSIQFSNFNTINVTNMSYMFAGVSLYTTYNNIDTLDLSGFDTSKVTNMSYMFSGCSVLTSLDLSSFNTSKVTTMEGMFASCSGLTSLDLSPLDTSKVTDMSYMFNLCIELTSLDLTPLNTSKVTNMSYMFGNCWGLTSLDLSPLDTSKVTDMSHMFEECSGLTSLDLSGWDTSNVTDMSSMFFYCDDLTTIYVGDSWSTTKVTNSTNMFYYCYELVGGNGTTSSSYVDKTYARIDTASTPGYFTAKP